LETPTFPLDKKLKIPVNNRYDSGDNGYPIYTWEKAINMSTESTVNSPKPGWVATIEKRKERANYYFVTVL
jgi:hypothetical protein